MTREEAIEELKKVDTLDMPARLCKAYWMAINSLEIDERYELEYERCCNDCILYETDACTRAGRAVNDEPCEDFIGAESEDME